MNSGHNDELILENNLFCFFIILFPPWQKSLWNKGIILSAGCRQWLIFTFRGTMTDLDDQIPDIQSEKRQWGVGSVVQEVKSKHQKRKSMKTQRQWWTVYTLKRICGQQLTITSPVIKCYRDATCQDVTISVRSKKTPAVSRCDLVTPEPRCRRDENTFWRLERGSWCPLVENVIMRLPLGCTSRTEQPAGACETQSLPVSCRSATFTAQK